MNRWNRTLATAKVVIADDDRGVVQLLARVMEPMGVRVHEAFDAMQALDVIHKTSPDLAILDIHMPAGNGLSVCEMIATDRWLADVGVIILTGDSDDEIQRRCRAMQVSYIRKGPQAVEQVKRTMFRLLSVKPETFGKSIPATGGAFLNQ